MWHVKFNLFCYYFFTLKALFKFKTLKYDDDVNEILLLVTINIFMNVYFY